MVGQSSHALFWNGTAESAIELTPAGYYSSAAFGICGSQQVGSGMKGGHESHALLWFGSADKYVDLTPGGFRIAEARATNGAQQVGWGVTLADSQQSTVWHDHALLWSGTAASAVDLHPSNYVYSRAFGIGGSQQVGYAVISSYGTHAMLWSGTAESAVDLNPSGFDESIALSTNGALQVGYGFAASESDPRALLWSGTADSVIDLQSLLGDGYTRSEATGIDALGNITGYAVDTTGNYHAVLWTTAVPEPSTLALMGFGGAGIFAYLRRRGRRNAE
jgi:hypothetical protein